MGNAILHPAHCYEETANPKKYFLQSLKHLLAALVIFLNKWVLATRCPKASSSFFSSILIFHGRSVNVEECAQFGSSRHLKDEGKKYREKEREREKREREREEREREKETGKALTELYLLS